MIIYDRDKDDIETLQLKKGYYTFIYKPDSLPENMTPGKLPKVIHINGKRAVVKKINVDKNEKKVYVDLYLAENPVVLVYVAYILGGFLLTWGLSLLTGDLVQIVDKVFNPMNLVLVILFIVVLNVDKFKKLFKK